MVVTIPKSRDRFPPKFDALATQFAHGGIEVVTDRAHFMRRRALGWVYADLRRR
jgi:hypothetical protein